MTAQQVRTETPVLQAVNVIKTFDAHAGLGRTATLTAVDGLDLELHRGEIVALVGESGSGKTTVARLLSLFYRPTEGTIKVDGRDVSDGRLREARREYYKRVQLLFQDPFASLNSLKRIRYILGRALRLHHRITSRKELEERTLDLLRKVNLEPAEQYIDKYPHELSGGQRQRVVIARGLAVEPEVLLADEPISMLDVSIRLDILNLLRRLRDDEQLAMLYITHDIASARYLADRIQVMYAGQIVESGPTEAVIQNPGHPYTQLLLESSPNPDAGARQAREDRFGSSRDHGEPPNLINPPSGCRFHPRCKFAMPKCAIDAPPSLPAHGNRPAQEGHEARCWLLDPTT